MRKWNELSAEERETVNKKMQEILRNYGKKSQEEMERIVKNGGYKGGLDGYYPSLTAISRERDQKLQELLSEYGLV